MGEVAVDAEVVPRAVVRRVQPVGGLETAGDVIAGDHERGEAQQGVGDVAARTADRGVDGYVDERPVRLVVLQRRLAGTRYRCPGVAPVAAAVDEGRAASRVAGPAEVARGILAGRLVRRRPPALPSPAAPPSYDPGGRRCAPSCPPVDVRPRRAGR